MCHAPNRRPLTRRAAALAAAVLALACGRGASAQSRTPAAEPTHAPAAHALSTVISPGDVINVQVVRQELLSGPRTVDGDGRILLPLAGQVRVAGLTAAQASERIARTLREKKLIRRPSVTVTFESQEQPRVFTVAGAVNAAGQYPLQTRVTLLQAIARARGPQDGARQNSVEVTRTSPGGAALKTKYDLSKADAATVVVQPGDYIFVPFARRRPDVNILTVLSAAGTLFYILNRR
jgi:polysaccharide export outer membrane protein